MPVARRLLAVWTPAVLAALLLAGCSAEPDERSGKTVQTLGPTTTSSAPAPSSSSSAPSSSSSAPSASAPATSPSALPTPPAHSGAQRVESSGVSFEVPEGWQSLKASEVFDGATDNPVIQELADRLGLSPEQLAQAMRTIDLMLISDGGAHGGVVDNVNVVSTGVPLNDSQVKLQLAAVGVKKPEISHTMTKLGEAISATYEVALGGKSLRGGGIYLDAPEGAVAVTVSSSEASTTRRLLAQILDTLDASDPETENG